MRDKKTTYRIMSAIKSKNTRPEKAFEKALRKIRVKFKKHYQVHGRPDFAIVDKKIAIFIDGDFWHGNNWRLRGLKNRKQELRSYKKFWSEKILNNIKRDKRNNKNLRRDGWVVLRFWESKIKKDISREISKVLKTIDASKK